jgi:hypothetical protein
MEQQNKYYTPDISELHVGYELEVEDFNQGHENGVQWIKTVIKHGGNYERNTHEQIFDSTTIQGIEARNDVYIRNTYRTKYLDQSDIESCGWIKDWDQNSSYSDCYKLITKSDISGQSDDEWVLWQYDKIVSISNELSNRCFDGECKSINELRKIMEWLNIK